MLIESAHLVHHVVIFGWDDFTRDIVQQLLAAENIVALAVESDEARQEVEENFDDGAVYVTVGRFAHFERFDDLRIDRCRKVFVNLESDHDNLIAVLGLRNAFGTDFEIDVVLRNEELEDTFYVAGVTYAVSPHAIASKVVASHVFEEDVGDFTSEILRATKGTDDCEFQQYRLLEGHEYLGMEYDEVFWDLRERFAALLLGVGRRDESGERELHKVPPADFALAEGDYLVVIVRGEHEEELVEMFGVDEGVARTFAPET